MKEMINVNKVRDIIVQIAKGVEFLHKYGIVHRDLKLDNILVMTENDESVSVKIIDFGLSKIMGKYEKTSEEFGSLCYSAPEILKKCEYDHKVDLWSFGVIIYFLLCGSFPFDDTDLDRIIRRIINGEFKFKPFDIYLDDTEGSIGAASLVISLLRVNRSLRAGVDMILENEWLNSNK
jgi:serine/threonine protein kinase